MEESIFHYLGTGEELTPDPRALRHQVIIYLMCRLPVNVDGTNDNKRENCKGR